MASRLARKVHKLHYQDISMLSAETLGAMLDEGAVEIIVDVADAGAWGEKLGKLFDKLESGVDGWRDQLRNKAVIVNFVDRR